MKQIGLLKVYSDGGARGNPGPAAAAFIVIKAGKLIHKDSKYLGEKTNNFAEYKGILMALSWIFKKYGKNESLQIVFYMDSQLAANQLSGKFKVKSKNLKPLISKIKKIQRDSSYKIFFKSIPRKKNKLADRLVNKSLDENL